MEKAKDSIDNNESKIDFTHVSDIHLVSNLLKLYFRTLPEPVIPFNLYNALLQIIHSWTDDTKDDEKVVQVAEQMKLLPIANAQLLSTLSTFLNRLAQHSTLTKMPVRNLATVFGPILMLSPVADANPMVIVTDTPLINELAVLLFQYPERIFAEVKMLAPLLSRKSPQSLIEKKKRLLKRRAEGKSLPPAPPTQPEPDFAFGLHHLANPSIEWTEQSTESRRFEGYVRVLIPFAALSEMQLSIRRGDVIKVIRASTTNDGWLVGQIRDRLGLFPESFCTAVVSSIDSLPKCEQEDQQQAQTSQSSSSGPVTIQLDNETIISSDTLAEGFTEEEEEGDGFQEEEADSDSSCLSHSLPSAAVTNHAAPSSTFGNSPNPENLMSFSTQSTTTSRKMDSELSSSPSLESPATGDSRKIELMREEIQQLKKQLRVSEKKLVEERRRREMFEAQALAHIEVISRKLLNKVQNIQVVPPS